MTQAAKEKGAIVVVGGQAATQLAKQLMINNKDIDAVVKYDGEEALLQIVEALATNKDTYSNIPNLVYRKNNEIIENKIDLLDVTKLPIPDRTLKGIDMGVYLENFLISNTEKGIDGIRVTNTHSKKGCFRSCSFCARIDKKIRCKTPQQTFDEFKYLSQKFGIDYIFDHSDNWIVKDWLREFENNYLENGGLDIKLMIFADVRDITSEVVEMLKTVRVDKVLMGIESCNEEVLFKNGKRINQDQIIGAVRLLTEKNIKVSLSYILGLMGETLRSVEETLDISTYLKNINDKIINYCNIIIPLPGSQLWDQMMSIPKLRSKYGHEYQFDMETLREDYLTHFCDLGEDPYNYLKCARDAMLSENKLQVLEYAR